jgi:hypothetical protein
MQPITSDHKRIDDRNLAISRLIAVKVSADPSLILRAQERLHRRPSSSNDTLEWLRILSLPLVDIVSFLNSNSEQTVRLCQSTPFLEAVTEAERRAINESHGIRARYPSSERNFGRY